MSRAELSIRQVHQVAVLWRDHAPGPVLEGGRARRVGLLAGLGAAAEVHRLALPVTLAARDRYRAYWRALWQGLAAAARTAAPRVLVFYPDLPGFLPARAWKVPVVVAWLLALRLLLGWRGKRLVVDVGDVPRWQSRSLNVPMPVRAGLLRLVELVLFALADRVTLATPELADRLARDLGLARGRFVTLANAAPRAVLGLRRPARRTDRARFIYVGCLDARQDRGIRALCAGFLARARGRAELVLMGEGGHWIASEFRSPRLRVLPALPQKDCARWLVRSDFALIPYPATGYYRTVCPIKLPLYALARVPIISTDVEPIRRVLERHQLGECLEPAEAFARWPALSRRYRGFRGGRDLEGLTWDCAAAVLLDV